MKPTTLTIENLQIKNNVFLAPLAGYTDYAFRKLLLERGVGLCFTELVSAKGLMYDSKNTKVLLHCGGDYENTAAQIFGSEPYYMRGACESDYLAPFKIVDINMGCPVPKVYKNGEGSALLKDIKKAEELIKECKKSGKIITIKIRTGLVKGDDIATEFAKMAENAGASLITIHGRVREDYYSGEPDFNAIAKAKKAVKIPVIANGGIFTEQDADIMLDKTGADGVMLARGAIADPFLASRLTNTKVDLELKEFMLEHVKLMRTLYDDKRTSNEFKKFVPYYLKGKQNAKDLKIQIYQADNTEKIIELICNQF